MKKELSIFADESGDLGKYVPNSQFYIVSFVFHEQTNDISNEIKIFRLKRQINKKLSENFSKIRI